MVKKFNVTVNGSSYEVEVEEIKGGAASAPRAAAPAAAAAPKAAPAPKAAAAPAPKAAPAAVPAGATTVDAPMPGTILDIKVAVGDTVTKGQLLLILEAMKMENEIFAPADGKVSAIHVTKGASVNTSDPMVSLG